MNPHIALHPEQIAEFCAQNSIKELSLFGSVLRDDRIYLEDAINAIDAITGFADGYSAAALEEDGLCLSAVLYKL